MSFWWTDFNVRMPWLGLIARNANNVERGSNGWMLAEEKLCGAYKKYVSQLPEDKFMQRIEYMKHAGDLGRSPMSMGLKVFLFVLVAAEGMGFSFLLSKVINSEASANLAEVLTYVITCVLAAVLAWITHAAGEQFYRTSLIRSCHKLYKETNGEQYASTPIALTDDQTLDKDKPSYTRCLNRIIDKPTERGSYSWTWLLGIGVLLIFVGSSVMRYKHLQSDLISKTQVMENSGGNPFASASALPAAVTEPQRAVDKKAQGEINEGDTTEGLWGIVILGVIFVVTQIVGFHAGYKHCLAGKQTYTKPKSNRASWWSSERDGAYVDTLGYSTYDSYWEVMQPIKDIVNTRLKDLQHRLKLNSHQNLELHNTFDDYLAEMSARSGTAREKHNQPSSSVPQGMSVTKSAPAATSQPVVSPLEQAKSDIERMSDKAQQQAYFAALDPDVREALKPWLKQRKEQAVAVSKAELDELF